MQKIAIIDRGRDPELASTRLTVFDFVSFFQEGWAPGSIALWYRISSAQVLAMKEYFEEHREEVLAAWEKIQERNRKGNPPEVKVRREQSRAKLYALKDKLRRDHLEREKHEGNLG